MRKSRLAALLLSLQAIFSVACNSLISETERIRAAYNSKNALTVAATDPADNSIAPYNQTYVDVTFSGTIDTATLTAQAQFGACSGSLQISYDGFTNCLGGALDVSANPRIRFTPVIFPKGLGFQIKITNAVVSSLDVPATPYTSSVGFRLGAPCGNFNCFFSYSAPLMVPAGNSNGIFLIRAGANIGKYLAYSTGTGTTTLIDPVTMQSSAGKPISPSCTTPSGVVLDFYSRGIANPGKQVLIFGISGTTCLYDHATDTFTPGSGVPSISAGAHIIYAQNSNDVYFVQGGGVSPNVYRYDAATGLFSLFANLGANSGDGSHTVRVTLGASTVKLMTFAGNNLASVNYFDEAGGTSGVANTFSNVLAGAASIEITTGVNSGKVLTALGGNTTNTSLYDVNLGAMATGAISTNNNIAVGSLLLRQSATSSFDQPLLISGGAGFGTYNSNRFDTSTLSFSAGPPVTGRVTAGSVGVYIPGTTGQGGFLVLNGNLSVGTSLYLPQTNSFHGSRTPTVVPNQGSSALQITAGSQIGKTLIIAGNLSDETAIFDPLFFVMSPGPKLNIPGTASSFSVPLNTGAVLAFTGGGTSTLDIYNPGTNIFTLPGAMPAIGPFGAGATSFAIANDPRIVIMRGNSSITADVYDQSSGTFSGTLSATGCFVNSVPFHFRYANGALIKELVYCQGTTFAIFDHATATFSIPASAGTFGVGMQAFTISPGGVNAGKVLIINGGNSVSLSLLDPATGNISAMGGSSACTAVGQGSQLFTLTSGVNAGKLLLVAGNDTPNTCLVDPVTPAFAAGPAVSATGSNAYKVAGGAVGFKTGGGLYATSFVVMSGASKNVWSTYVP